MFENSDNLIKIALSLNLDASYYVKDDVDKVYDNDRNLVVLVLTYLNQRLQDILANVLLVLGNPNMFIFNQNIEIPSSIRIRHFIVNKEDDIKHPIHQLFMGYKWKSGGFILLTNNNKSIHAESYHTFLNGINKEYICYYKSIINPNNDKDFHKLVQKVKEQNLDLPTVLFGERKDQMKFIDAVEQDDYRDIERFWIGNDLIIKRQ